MIISHKTQSIFIHIQKTAGSSIEQLLRAIDPTVESHPPDGKKRHICAIDLRNMIDPDIWNSYHKFSFVRNPWDRLLSWHRMCMQVEGNKFQTYVKTNYPEFSDFIRNGDSDDGLANTCRNQLDYIADSQGNVLVDFVGRFENLEEDFRKLKFAGNEVKLPHVNKSLHTDYRGYYTDETKEIVEQRFARDCEFFGYRFDCKGTAPSPENSGLLQMVSRKRGHSGSETLP